MRKNIGIVVVWFFSAFLFAQQGDGGTIKGLEWLNSQEVTVNQLVFQALDIQKLQKEDWLNDSLGDGPWRFGVNYDTSIDVLEQGTWFQDENNNQTILLRIHAEQAKTINLIFSNLVIPEGNELYVYSLDGGFVLGKFTDNHVYQGTLGTELVPGEELVVEYRVPAYHPHGEVEISSVVYGYRTANEFQLRVFGASGNCNMNVNCPDGAPYVDQRNSAVMLVAGTNNGFCSGALINNTEFDGKPYVLTADHCRLSNSNIPAWVFRFNWQSDGCANPSSAPTADTYQSLSGAELKAKYKHSDFLLVEITGGLENGTVPEECNPYFAGWDRRDVFPERTFSIHHPSGDIKKISFDDAQPSKMQVTIGGITSEPEGAWRVLWDRMTVTEGGSSGSPLFNQYGQIIGQLWGGQSGCHNAGSSNAYDFYGRLYTSWKPAGSGIAEQLKHWLDPNNKGNEAILGYDPYATPLDNNAAVLSIFGHDGEVCGNGYTPYVELMNRGLNALTSMVLHYDYSNGDSGVISWTGNLSINETESVELPYFEVENGYNQVTVVLSEVNHGIDEDLEDNVLSSTFIANPTGVDIEFKFYMSCWPQENSWEIKDADGQVIYSGGDYPAGNNTNFLDARQLCLSNGCYTLTLYDAFGDGVEGIPQPSCDYNGSMLLRYKDSGEVLAEMPSTEANFGYERSFEFCITQASIQDEVSEMQFELYPNPTNGAFVLDFPWEGKKVISIKDATGKLVATTSTSEKTFHWNQSELSAGLYFIQVSTDSNSFVKQLVVH